MSNVAFFAIPKVLNTDSKYASLSVEAKYLYGLMRDRFKLSVKNRFKDTVGTFIYMPRKVMSGFLKKSLPTIRKFVAELVKVGLIIEKRMGLTKCNKIYVQLLPGEKEGDFQTKEKPYFTPERNEVSPSNHNPSYINLRGYQQGGKNEKKRPQKTVLAQQYTQREYSKEFYASLFEQI